MKPKDYSISILMPTYNNVCVGLVEMLHAQCERIARRDATGLVYEIVVADDGSTDSRTVTENRAINALDHCRFIERKINSGRSAIRNFLAKESCGEWLLFIDSDVVIDCDDFIGRYLDSNATAVVCGGISPGQYPDILHLNLRYKYEWAEAHRHTAEARSKAEHKCFRTTNFMVRRDIMLDNPFDEAITAYGYEDVVFGKRLCEKGIGVVHIDNPVVLADYEDNQRFVAKTEESLRTLFQLKDRLSGYSNLLGFTDKIARIGLPGTRLGQANTRSGRPNMRFGLATALLAWHKLAGKLERKNLTGKHPSLLVFKIYKIGYYISLK